MSKCELYMKLAGDPSKNRYAKDFQKLGEIESLSQSAELYKIETNPDLDENQRKRAKEQLITSDVNNYLISAARVILNNEKSEEILKELKATLYATQTLSVEDYGQSSLGYAVPNFTAQQLRDKFPDITFGKNTPSVLLLRDNSKFPVGHGLFFNRVIVDGNEFYVVPQSNIKGFARHTRFLEQIDVFSELNTSINEFARNENLDPDNYIENIELLIENISKKAEEGIIDKADAAKQIANLQIYKEFYPEVKKAYDEVKHNITTEGRERVKMERIASYLENRLSEYLEKDKIGRDLSYVQSKDKYNLLMSEIDESINKQKEQIDKISGSKRTEKNKQQAITTCNNNISKLEKYKRVLEFLYKLYNISNTEALFKAIETLKTSELIPEETKILESLTKFNRKNEDVVEHELGGLYTFLRSYVTNIDKIEDHISAQSALALRAACLKVLETKQRTNINNPLVKSILSLDPSAQTERKFLPFFSKDKVIGLGDLLVSMNLLAEADKKDIKKIRQVLIDTFFEAQQEYVEDLSKSSSKGIYLKRKSFNISAFAEPFEASSSEEFPPMTDDQKKPRMYLGYYLFKCKDKATGLPKYFYSNTLHATKPQGLLYNSEEELFEAIQKAHSKAHLWDDTNMFAHYFESTIEAINKPKFRFFEKGEVIPIINYPVGDIKIPRIFTVSYFDNFWAPQLFEEYPSILDAIKKLDTAEKKALFITHWGHLTKHSVEYNLEKIRQTIDDIDNADTIYYSVINNASIYRGKNSEAIGKEREYQSQTIIRLEPVEFYTPTLANQQLTTESNDLKTDLEAIARVFTKNGIETRTVTTEEMIRIQKPEGPITEQDKVNVPRGIMHNGIIFLRTDGNNLKLRTPFHEYTHLLVGILKHNNAQNYETLLKTYFSRRLQDADAQDIYKAKHNGYVRAKKYMNEGLVEEFPKNEKVTLDNANILIVEEMFCDDFGDYLSKNFKHSVGEIFSMVAQNVVKSTIFDDISVLDLLQNAEGSVQQVFTMFSNQIRVARSNFGFKVPTGKVSFEKLTKLLQGKDAIELTKDETFESVDSDGLLIKCD